DPDTRPSRKVSLSICVFLRLECTRCSIKSSLHRPLALQYIPPASASCTVSEGRAKIPILLDFWLGGAFLAPAPLLVECLGAGVPVGIAWDITTSTGVPVPIPGATDASAGLVHSDVQTHTIAQSIQGIEP